MSNDQNFWTLIISVLDIALSVIYSCVADHYYLPMLTSLLKLAAKLRSPTGCPWDRARKFKDLPPMLIEESEEIAQAIRKKDWKNLREEIGDVLYNLCMLISMAEEKGYFSAEDVIDGSARKIRSRHTWVFGKDKAKTPADVLRLWKKNKKNEK